jgi:RecA-family ATPase
VSWLKDFIFDSVSAGFAGNENDRSQVTQFVQHGLGSIALAIGTVVALAHPSRAGMSTGTGDSGSTGWNAAFRSRLSLAYPTDDQGKPLRGTNERYLSCMKANYAANGGQLQLVWKDGAFESKYQAGQAGEDTRPSVDVVFMDILTQFTAQNRNLSVCKTAGKYAPKEFAHHSDSQGYTKSQFAAAMDRLFSGEKIENQQYGRTSDWRHRIVPTSPQEGTSVSAPLAGDTVEPLVAVEPAPAGAKAPTKARGKPPARRRKRRSAAACGGSKKSQ